MSLSSFLSPYFGKGYSISSGFIPLPLQIGMHHVALDRPGTDDRDLDHQVIKRARLQARQHVHLRAALDLEHAERFAPAQHVVDFRHLARNGRKLPAFALVQFDQIETFADAAQHAQRQHVDLHHPDFVDVVLVPFDEGAVVHRGVADRHIFVEPVLGQHEAADMLRQMTRKFDQFGRELAPRDRSSDFADRDRPAGPASRSRPSPQLPQTVSASSAVTSSVRPSALPTSRIALRGR